MAEKSVSQSAVIKKKWLTKPVRYKMIPYPQKTVAISDKEYRLYKLIMNYRQANLLPEIPLSVALTYVAQTHAGDLTDNYRRKRKCNLNSWSGNGIWKPCCYCRDHSQAECMWNKPRELTTYNSDGFEITYYSSGEPKPEAIIEKWKKNPVYNGLLLNSAPWSITTWKAVGIGIYGNYALVWIGKSEDQDGPPELPVTESSEVN